MNDLFHNLDFEKTVKFLTLIVGAIGLFKALIEYTKAQRWKKAEFLAKEVKEFFADNDVQRALLMLDWSIVDIPLFENEIEDKKKFSFNDLMLVTALRHHNETYFTDEETIIRQTFDEFLFKLGMFQNYIDSKLITKKDIEPYLSYWINLIGNIDLERKDEQCFRQLWRFINYYDYKPVIKLFESFKYNITTEKMPDTIPHQNQKSAGS
ncbi:hypothetical protein V9K67_20700 [Paraflavisolibacter sp. H34]|uniref:hypothetical protein n=1 Tax=Huijunlia imazamoxiresistens TaxID=3127457 RepID=UPI003016F4C2